MWRLAGAVMLGHLAGWVSAADIHADPENYRELVRQLQPGDRLLLAPGDYVHGLTLHNLSGNPTLPIVIEAAQPTTPPRLLARPGANTISLLNVRYLILRYLELDGRNIPVDAIKAEGHSRYADFITLEHLYIHHHAASQQNVGISSKCAAHGWQIRHNRIEQVGTGMYLGNSDGSAPFVAGLIELNQISHTLGYNLQIKHQTNRPEGLANQFDTVIRYNVFSKQDAEPGPLARPNLLLGHFPLSGPGREDRYLVYGNLFLPNPSEAVFQAEGRVALYNNIFINDHGDAIHIQPHNDIPRDMAIFSNTIVASGAGIQIRRAGNSPYRQRVVANLVVAQTPITGVTGVGNIMLPYRRDLSALTVPDLVKRLQQSSLAAHTMPEHGMREMSSFPDWTPTQQAGATPPTPLLNLLNRQP